MPKGRKRVIAPNRMGDVTCLLLPRPKAEEKLKPKMGSLAPQEAKEGVASPTGSTSPPLPLSLPFSLLGTTINLFLLADAAQTAWVFFSLRLSQSQSTVPKSRGGLVHAQTPRWIGQTHIGSDS